MPGGDGTGPMGRGPMTGRAWGNCAGAGWGRRQREGWFWGMSNSPAMTKEVRIEILKQEAAMLERQLGTIREQIDRLHLEEAAEK